MYPDWESVYKDTVEGIYRMVFSRVGNRPDTEDLTSEVFRRALPALRLSHSEAEVRGYLVATCRTVLASHWRDRFGIELTTLEPDTQIESSPEDVPEGDASRRANEILEALPERYRRILELRFLECRSIRDSARAMNLTVGNAKVLQHRALRMAAEKYEGGSL